MSPDLSRFERQALLRQLSGNDRRELRLKTATLRGFALGLVGVSLRPYQLDAAGAILKSVFARDGNSFVIIFARQSGKDELLANLILFLLARLAERGASIVCAQPTFRPQTLQAMDRLESRASQRPFFLLGGFRRTHGHIFRLLRARVTYLSADPAASVVGATADRLLIINEAQDVLREVYDKRFAPMAASGNATRVFSGTSWTSDTLLERERRLALQLEGRDGLQRVFLVDGEQVARSNKFYARFLENEIRKLGRQHPLVRTQYFCENVEALSGMFTPAHRLLMRGDRAPMADPPILRSQMGGTAEGHGGPGEASSIANRQSEIVNPNAFLLDVAGQEEASASSPLGPTGTIESYLNYSRDAVTLRIVEIDLSTLESLQAPTYRVVHTLQWTGQNHVTVFGQLKALAEAWRPQHIVMDATGVGEGLWAMLDRAFPTRVIPVKFTQSVKSELGYGFLAIINSGRFRDCSGDGASGERRPRPPQEGWTPTRGEIDRQYAACQAEILIGPTKTMRWGVPEGRRDEDGHLIHDDIPVTDSLAAILDRLEWSVRSPTLIVHGRDPLEDMDRYHDG